VLCVAGADPVSLQRAVRALSHLREVLPGVNPRVLVNRVRRDVVPGDARREIATALRRFAGVEVAAFLPHDQAAADAALGSGRTLGDVAPRSPLRIALRDFAGQLTGTVVPAGRGRAGRHGR